MVPRVFMANQPTLRNKGLIFGLIKGNQGFFEWQTVDFFFRGPP